MELRVTLYGEPVLRETGQTVDTFDNALRELVSDMLDTMYAEEGIGLAAPQVGRSMRICVIDISMIDPAASDWRLDGKKPPMDLIMPMAMVNPSLRPVGTERATAEEGCLSIPNVRAEVTRPDQISVEFQDTDGHPHLLEATGWFARVVQHEVDHLNGVLFIDHLSPRERRLLEKKLAG